MSAADIKKQVQFKNIPTDNGIEKKYYCSCGNGSIFYNVQQHIKSTKHKNESNTELFTINILNELNNDKKKYINEFVEKQNSIKYEEYLKYMCKDVNNRKFIVNENKFKNYISKELKR